MQGSSSGTLTAVFLNMACGGTYDVTVYGTALGHLLGAAGSVLASTWCPAALPVQLLSGKDNGNGTITWSWIGNDTSYTLSLYDKGPNSHGSYNIKVSGGTAGAFSRGPLR